MQLIILL